MPKRAFTLTEILVATVILALTMAGLSNVFVASQRQTTRARSHMAVGELSRYYLDPLQNDVRQDTWTSNCLGSATNCAGVQTLDGITYTPTFNFTTIGGTVRKAKVSIGWTEP